MAFTLWLSFLWLSIVLALSPGPAVLFVLSQGLGGGRPAALRAALGILAANGLYFTLSGLGFAAAVLAIPGLVSVLTWGGIAWLLWLAVHALRSHGSRLVVGAAAVPAPFRSGFTVQIANPKCLLYFSSILPAWIDVHAANAWPLGLQVAVFGATSTVAEFFVLAGYGALAAAAAARLADERWSRWFDRAAGAMLLLVALWMAARAFGAA